MTSKRAEVEAAFINYWQIGPVAEDWLTWSKLFVPDAEYYDHFWGQLHGQAEISRWIDPVMKGVPEIYTILDWYVVDGNFVVFHCQNRRDNPDRTGPDYWDFPGLSVITYAGNGCWESEEDFWSLRGARLTSEAYGEACQRAGVDDPSQRMTRRFWSDHPSWARTEAPPSPSWLARPDIAAITKPRELAALLGR